MIVIGPYSCSLHQTNKQSHVADQNLQIRTPNRVVLDADRDLKKILNCVSTVMGCKPSTVLNAY